jgi:hypothetical protein
LNATHAPVPDAQDGFGVGAHDQVDVVGTQPERLEGLVDLIGFVDAQEQPALAAVFVGEALNGLADRGRVDHRHQLGQVLFEHLVVEQLVSVMQLLEEQVSAEIGCHALQLVPHPVGLLCQRKHRGRKPAGQPEPPSLFTSEADTTVETRRGHRYRNPWHVAVAHRHLRRQVATSSHGSADRGERILKSD